MSKKLIWRWFLNAAGAVASWIALTNTPGCAPAQRAPKVRTFRSRPDLSPPAVEVIKQASGTAPGYIFVAPKEGAGQNGPMILDDRGQLVWFRPLQRRSERTMHFKVQRFRGESVLTWWEGVRNGGYGLGEHVMPTASTASLGGSAQAMATQGTITSSSSPPRTLHFLRSSTPWEQISPR